MTQFRPVFWHQGLFLQPQHFQLADLHQQERLLPFQRYLHPHFWGVARMAMQATALPNGTSASLAPAILDAGVPA